MNIIRKIRSSHSEQDEAFYNAMRKTLRYRPQNLDFYKEAFTHSSLKKKIT